MPEAGSVKLSIINSIATVEFEHPQSNSLPGALLRSIAEKIKEAGASDAANVVLLQSAGDKSFCAGASFDELLSIKTEEQSRYFFSGFAILILAIRACPKFVVTRVQGKAVGGGVGVIAASDYVIADTSAAIKLSEFALGFGPFVIGPAVERKIGVAAFAEMAIDAEWRSAEWAFGHGLYSKVTNNRAELSSVVGEFVAKLSSSSKQASLQLKKALWQATPDWDILLQERVATTSRLALSEYAQAKIQAFKNRS